MIAFRSKSAPAESAPAALILVATVIRNHISEYGNGVRLRHTVVMFTDGVTAYVNPDLLCRHGAAVRGQPDWYKGQPL